MKQILTSTEFVCTITHSGPSEIMRRAERKLKDFQAKITSDRHIRRVNKYIPMAEDFATEVAGDDKATWDRMFHLKMNELTRAAGLRV